MKHLKISASVVTIALIFVLVVSYVVSRQASMDRVAQRVFQGLVPISRIVNARKLEGGSEPRFGCIVLHASQREGIEICQALGLLKTSDEQMRRVGLDYVRHGWHKDGELDAQVFVGTLKSPPYFFVYAVLGDTNSYFIY